MSLHFKIKFGHKKLNQGMRKQEGNGNQIDLDRCDEGREQEKGMSIQQNN